MAAAEDGSGRELGSAPRCATYRRGVDFHGTELIQLFVLLVGVGALLVIAPLTRVPYPILMVVGGVLLSFAPGLPDFELPPELVLIAFLPPLLYSAAFFTSLRDLRANVKPIGALAIGLVATTTVGVAAVAHWTVDMPWDVAFVLGAVVSPTDPLAATSIARRLGVPRRIVAIVEGESLVNDATALVFYRVAVVAVTTGAFSLWESGGRLILNALAGIGIGLAVGYVVRQVRKRMNDAPSEIAIAFLTGYLAYLPAEAAGVSAVLAAVTAGVYLGWHTPELTNAQTRLQGFAFWTILVFILNAALFTLIGLQLPIVLEGLDRLSTAELAAAAVAVCATVVVLRFAWVLLLAARRRNELRLPVPQAAVVSWAGMRGAVSLAAALAIPLETDTGTPFPYRHEIIFLAFSVILFTLVVQGLSLPALIRVLGVEDDGSEGLEEAKARKRAAQAALARLEELTGEDWVLDDTAERLRGLYDFRVRRFGERFDPSADGSNEQRSQSYQRLRRELLDAERDAVLELRRSGVVSDDVMHRVLRDIALEDVRLDFER
jgi:monovalent cation/hydrogen antiporter